MQPIETVQGNLVLMYRLQEWLKEIGGFAGVSLQPAAGAHGEFTGVTIIRAYHQSRNDTQAHQDAHPRFGPWHQPGQLRHARLRGGADPDRRQRQRRSICPARRLR